MPLFSLYFEPHFRGLLGSLFLDLISIGFLFTIVKNHKSEQANGWVRRQNDEKKRLIFFPFLLWSSVSTNKMKDWSDPLWYLMISFWSNVMKRKASWLYHMPLMGSLQNHVTNKVFLFWWGLFFFSSFLWRCWQSTSRS